MSTSPAVRDRRAPVAAERLRPQLHTRRRLAALVLGAVVLQFDGGVGGFRFLSRLRRVPSRLRHRSLQ
jgi:hypothetical protein